MAMAARTGGVFSMTESMRPSARKPRFSGSSKMRSASLPRSMAMATIRSKVFSGVNTRFARDSIRMAPVLHAL